MKSSQRASIVPLLLIVATLLVGQRFGFVWAGGDGYVPEVGAVDMENGDTYRRGESVTTGAENRIYVRVGTPGDIASLAEIWLDHNTEIVLDQTNANGVTIRLVRGRLLVISHEPIHPLTVKTNFTESEILAGTMSVVNYDFLETTSIAPINTTATVTIRGEQPFETKKPVNVHETPPVSIVETPFDVTAASVAEFYQWAMR